MTPKQRYFQVAVTMLPSFAAAARTQEYPAALWPLNELLTRYNLKLLNGLQDVEARLEKIKAQKPDSQNDKQAGAIREILDTPGIRNEFEDSFRLVCRDGGYLTESRKDALWRELRTPVMRRFIHAFEFREIKLAA